MIVPSYQQTGDDSENLLATAIAKGPKPLFLFFLRFYQRVPAPMKNLKIRDTASII